MFNHKFERDKMYMHIPVFKQFPNKKLSDVTPPPHIKKSNSLKDIWLREFGSEDFGWMDLEDSNNSNMKNIYEWSNFFLY